MIFLLKGGRLLEIKYFQLNSHTYLCPCGADVHIIDEEKFWWRDCTEDNPPKNILCWSCSYQLEFDWLIGFRKAMEQWDCEFDNVGCKFSFVLCYAIGFRHLRMPYFTFRVEFVGIQKLFLFLNLLRHPLTYVTS